MGLDQLQHPLARQEGNALDSLKDFRTEHGPSQGQNLALARSMFSAKVTGCFAQVRSTAVSAQCWRVGSDAAQIALKRCEADHLREVRVRVMHSVWHTCGHKWPGGAGIATVGPHSVDHAQRDSLRGLAGGERAADALSSHHIYFEVKAWDQPSMSD